MRELRNGWCLAKLGDLGEWTSGGTPLRSHPEYYGTGIPWVKTGDLPDGLLTHIPESISELGLQNSAAKKLPAGTLLVAMYGATIGKLGVLTCEAASNQACAALLPNGGTAGLIPFVFHYLLARRDDLRRIGQGGAQPNISQAILKEYDVGLPPLEEQRRIVAKIKELTARNRRAMDALDAVSPLLDQLRQSILGAAFRGDLTAEWRANNSDVEPGERYLARIHTERRTRQEAGEVTRTATAGRSPSDDRLRAKNTEPNSAEWDRLPLLPRGWCWATVAEAGDAHLGRMRSPDKHGGNNVRPYLRVMNVHEDRIDVSDVMEMQFEPDEFEFYRLLPGDVLLNEGQSKELIGRPAMFRGELPDVAFTNSLIRFRPYGGAPPEYALALFRHYMRSGRFQKIAQITTNIAHLGATRFREIEYPFPPLEEQKIIANTVMGLLKGVDALQEHLALTRERCATLQRSILRKAFRGELVPQNPNEEPASVLLERMRAARISATPEGARTHRQSRTAEGVSGRSEDDSVERATTPIRCDTERKASNDLNEVTKKSLLNEVSLALWTLGPLEKDEAVRRAAQHLRQAGYVQFERLRTGGPLFGQVLEAVESAIKAGRLDRPRRGHVRACKTDAATYTADDWRHALVACLGAQPTDRDEAIRAAAEWARDNLGLEFTRLRSDGHIVEGLRSAINSAVRRGEVIRLDAKRISRATS